MKYVLLFVETEDFERDLEAMGPASPKALAILAFLAVLILGITVFLTGWGIAVFPR